jgi:hypothetical protein
MMVASQHDPGYSYLERLLTALPGDEPLPF